MNKKADKFCPNCGHHLYEAGMPNMLWCNDCGEWIDAGEELTLEQAQSIRDGWEE